MAFINGFGQNVGFGGNAGSAGSLGGFTGSAGSAGSSIGFSGSLSQVPFQSFNPQQMAQFQSLLVGVLGAMAQLFQGFSAFGGGQLGGGLPGGLPGGGFPGGGFPGGFPGGGFPIGGGGFPGGFPIGGGGFPFQPQPFPFPQPTFPQPQPQPGGQQRIGPEIPVDFNYSNLNPQQRTQTTGLDDRGRAALHLWGIQTGASGKNDGGVYFNVLNNPEQFKPAEVALVKELYNKEMQMYGGVTGKLLDQQFFGVYQNMTGKDISQRYGNRPITFAQGPVNMDNRVTGQNGLSQFDNAVIRLWGHDRLDNGTNDGSILAYSLRSNNSFDAGLNPNDMKALLAADVADGRRDGSSLETSFLDSLDRIYLGGPGANQQSTLGRAGLQAGQVNNIVSNYLKNSPPGSFGIPPGVDITNVQNIGRCPVLGQSVGQAGTAGAAFGAGQGRPF